MDKMFVCYFETDADATGFLADDSTVYPTTRMLSRAKRFSEPEMIDFEEKIPQVTHHWFEV